MRVEIVEVTPAMAREWLKRNVHNFRKKVRDGLIIRLASDMPHWDLNGESIKFDSNDCLVDGQHRLMACIKANVSFRTVVVWGVERDSNIDTGAKRSLIDLLRYRGESSVSEISAGLNWLYRYFQVLEGAFLHPYSQQKTAISNDTLLDLLRLHPRIRESAKRARQVRDWLPSSISVGLHYVAHARCPEYADSFIESLGRGVSLDADDPIFLLRARLETDRKAKSRLLPVEKCAIAITAWNNSIQARPMKTLRWRAVGPTKEAFPLIVDQEGLVIRPEPRSNDANLTAVA